MGNEMGNNNSSGLQEQDNLSTAAKGSSVQEAVHANGAAAEGENHNVSVADEKDCHEKNGVLKLAGNFNGVVDEKNREEENLTTQVIPDNGVAEGENENHIVNNVAEEKEDHHEKETRLASDWPKAAENGHVLQNQKSNEKEKDETEVHPLAESPKMEVKSHNDVGGSELQPSTESKDSVNHEGLEFSSSDENLSTSDDQLENETSVKNEEEEIQPLVSETSSSQDPKLGRLESTKCDTDPPVKDTEENGYLTDENESTVSDLNPEEVETEEEEVPVKQMVAANEEISDESRLESKAEAKELEEKMMKVLGFQNGEGIKCIGYQLETEITDPGISDFPEEEAEAVPKDESLNPGMETFDTVDKSTVLSTEANITVLSTEANITVLSTEANMVLDKEPEQEKKPAKGSKIDNENRSESNDHLLDMHTKGQNTDLIVLQSFSDYKNNERQTADSTNQTIEAYKENLQIELHVHNHQNEASAEYGNNMQDNIVLVPESGKECKNEDIQQNVEIETKIAQSINGGSISELNHDSSVLAVGSDYQAEEFLERLSTESNPNNSNGQTRMQKSPSFGLDLRIEAKDEESSDRTPLLDKTAPLELSAMENTHCDKEKDRAKYHEMAAEEKVVRMEKSDSEKSKSPFLGFLKEEEEARIVANQQKQVSNGILNLTSGLEETTSSPKSKEKRKHRSSLFTNCMCCTTVLH